MENRASAPPSARSPPAAVRHQMLGGLPGLDLRIRRVVAVPMHMLRPAHVHMQRCRMHLTGIILPSLWQACPRLLAGCARPPGFSGFQVSCLKPYTEPRCKQPRGRALAILWRSRRNCDRRRRLLCLLSFSLSLIFFVLILLFRIRSCDVSG